MLDETGRALRSTAHRTIERVTRDIGERMHFNTAVAAVMELANAIQDHHGAGHAGDRASVFAVAVLLRLLFPFAPHLAAEAWERVFAGEELERVPWPTHDPRALEEDTVEIVVQIKGKVRARIEVATGASEDELRAAALAETRVIEALGGREPRKVIVVPGRLVNVVP